MYFDTTFYRFFNKLGYALYVVENLCKNQKVAVLLGFSTFLHPYFT